MNIPTNDDAPNLPPPTPLDFMESALEDLLIRGVPETDSERFIGCRVATVKTGDKSSKTLRVTLPDGAEYRVEISEWKEPDAGMVD